MENKAAYICGSISNDPGYKLKFFLYESFLLSEGYRVMNPAILPEGFKHKQYMNICFPMIDACKCFFILPDWNISIGAKKEIKKAVKDHKEIFFITLEKKEDKNIFHIKPFEKKYFPQFC